jgi:UDPglucose 6-dehydrogenase
VNVVCIGSGYVGSVTGAAFAALGNRTTVVDLDQSKVDLMNAGHSPIFEPGLDELIAACIGHTLFATTSYEAVREANVVFIGVGTPSRPDGSADLKYVLAAAESIGKHLHPGRFTVIVDKSTVPVGTAELVTEAVAKASGLTPGEQFAVVSNPEFLREGYALEDVFFPDRVVIGSDLDRAKQVMRDLYQPLIERVDFENITKNFAFRYPQDAAKAKYFETDTKSAEMIKYASNAFLAVKISYINEVARLCEALGANALEVAKGMGMDTRIGEKFLQVSSGWSGSCFPKDTAEFFATSVNFGSELSIVKAAVESNHQMHLYCVQKVQRRLGTLAGKNVGILGLTFKPNTDDARKTQATTIIEELLNQGARVVVHDPQGMGMFKHFNPELTVEYVDEAQEVAMGADAVLLLTHWQEYLELDWGRVLEQMRQPYLFDTRNCLSASDLQKLGWVYEGLGVGTLDSQYQLS